MALDFSFLWIKHYNFQPNPILSMGAKFKERDIQSITKTDDLFWPNFPRIVLTTEGFWRMKVYGSAGNFRK